MKTLKVIIQLELKGDEDDMDLLREDVKDLLQEQIDEDELEFEVIDMEDEDEDEDS